MIKLKITFYTVSVLHNIIHWCIIQLSTLRNKLRKEGEMLSLKINCMKYKQIRNE